MLVGARRHKRHHLSSAGPSPCGERPAVSHWRQVHSSQVPARANSAERPDVQTGQRCLRALAQLVTWCTAVVACSALGPVTARESTTVRGNMCNMSTHNLKELRSRLGAIVREVAATGEEVIVTDSGTEVAVIVSMADYERLHEHADVADALRLRGMRERPFASMSMSEMLDALGVDPAVVLAS